MRRRSILIAFALVLATAAVASAATFGLTSANLGAGQTTVSRCDTNGFTGTYTVTSGNVVSVTIDDIADPGCEGGSMNVTLVNGSGTIVGASATTTLPTDGGTTPNSVTVAVSPTPAESTVIGLHMSVTGP
jgi:hypothetical protein